MHKFLRIMLMLLAGLALTACGGGGSGGGFTDGGNDPDPTTQTVDSVTVLASSGQLPSSGSSSVTISAIVRDASNVVLEGVAVTFSTNSGSLQVVSATTDASGIATATLSTPGNPDNRTITVTAEAGGQSGTVDISVTGTTITIAGPTALGFGDSGTLTFTLKDSDGTGIASTDLTIAASGGLGLSATSATTNSSGQATVTVTGVSGSGTVTASGAGTASTHDITVSSDSFSFTDPADATEVNLGVSESVTVRLLSNGVGVDGETIDFTATRGNLSVASAVTAGGGYATVDISSATAGGSVVTATSPSLSTTLNLVFVATTASTLDLNASPANLSINPAGAPATNTSTITATVRDADNNLVKNKTVNFTLTDISGGNISPASAVTDINGQAVTIYTAGANTSATDGVVVTATVAGTPAATDTATLTVGGQALSITLSTGNSIEEDGPTTYNYPYEVRLADASGAPVANRTVTLSVIPTHYYKGEHVWSGLVWAREGGAVQCVNEDVDSNGLLNEPPDTDTNNNGTLEPGNVVVVAPATVTTDANGRALFDVTYGQDRAYWVRVQLSARASVAGSESTNSVNFDLPGLADDYSDEAVAPPGQQSPYGIELDCTNPD